MARTIGTRSLRDLIEDGTLRQNEDLVIGRRSAPDTHGKLRKDGSIEVSGQVFATPSAAARSVLDLASVDGWVRWRVPRLDRKNLAELRDAQ